jgi:peroxiredoxin
MKSTIKIVAIFLLSFFSLSSASFAQDSVKKDSVKIADNMNFTLRNVKGEEVNFRDLLGKGPLLVNFWALWCEPCKQEMKAFKALVEKFKAQGVSMVAINTDQVRSLAKVRAYVTTQDLPFPVLTDPDGSVARDNFSMESLPYSLILMPDGTVYKKHIGYTAGDEQTTEKEIADLVLKLSSAK